MSQLNAREETLVALGAAIASNCLPCVEFHLPAARRAGCSDFEIAEAIRIADKVRRVPARMVLETAQARIEENPSASSRGEGAECDCSASRRSGSRSGCVD